MMMMMACLVTTTSNNNIVMVMTVMTMMMILARGLKTVMTQRTTGPRYSDSKATFHETRMMALENM